MPPEMAHRPLASFRKGLSRQLGAAVASVATVVMAVAIGLSLMSWRVLRLGALTTPLVQLVQAAARRALAPSQRLLR